MEFFLGLMAGFILWPWWAMLVFGLVCVVDIVLLETECEGWGTALLIGAVAGLAWLAGDVNVFMWVWTNLASIVKFLLLYFVVGGLWSIAKWYFYLLGVRDKMKTKVERAGVAETTRPYESYANNNVSRILGWIGHWPLSMIGTIFGDFLTRIVKNIYYMLSGIYEKIGNTIFSDFDPRN